jgi:NADH-quinone oxidoreductase subunit L
MLVNRVGDVGLALGSCYIFAIFKTVDYAVVFSLIPSLSNKTVTFLGFDFWCETIVACLLLWGAVGKSAQLGLHI